MVIGIALDMDSSKWTMVWMFLLMVNRQSCSNGSDLWMLDALAGEGPKISVKIEELA